MDDLKSELILNILTVSAGVGLIFAGIYLWLPLAVLGLIIITLWALSHGIF